MKALTDKELADLIERAVHAERAACAGVCIRLGERAQTVREKGMALACFAAIFDRGNVVDGGQGLRPSERSMKDLIDAASSRPRLGVMHAPRCNILCGMPAKGCSCGLQDPRVTIDGAVSKPDTPTA